MKSITVQGREFMVEFDDRIQGFRMTVWEDKGDSFEILPDYDNQLHFLETKFEALCNLSSHLFDEAVYGEDFALALEIPMITSDEDYCIKCNTIAHYEELKIGHNLEDSELEALGMSTWDYVCLECLEAVKVGA